MSMQSVIASRDHRYDDVHREACAKAFGQHIRSLRLLDDRPLEELALGAGLTIEEWEAIENGQLRLAWEQVLMLAMVLRLGRSWMPHLMKLCAGAWGDE
jgi:hypothetical protein